MVEAVITRGRRQENFNRPETETIDFRNVSVDVRIAYCNVLLKSMLTEKSISMITIRLKLVLHLKGLRLLKKLTVIFLLNSYTH